jgi:hypothetical protein
MTFRSSALAGSGTSAPGEIDYRLARRARIADYRKGRLARQEVCDAQPELVRNAEHCSVRTSRRCPICEARQIVLVTYAFGPRLPPSGRCVTSRAELTALAARRNGRYSAYEVEVCRACRWNHLARCYLLTPLAT